MASKLRTQIIFTQDRKIQKIQIELKQQKKRIIISQLKDDKPLSYYVNPKQLIDIEKTNFNPQQLEAKKVAIVDVVNKPKTKNKIKEA